MVLIIIIITITIITVTTTTTTIIIIITIITILILILIIISSSTLITILTTTSTTIVITTTTTTITRKNRSSCSEVNGTRFQRATPALLRTRAAGSAHLERRNAKTCPMDAAIHTQRTPLANPKTSPAAMMSGTAGSSSATAKVSAATKYAIPLAFCSSIPAREESGKGAQRSRAASVEP